MRKLLPALVFLSIAADVAVAATIHVPGDQPTIQAGIVATAAGDTVLVAAGTYYEHYIAMRSGVYLASETGLGDCVTIDAQEQDRVFYCDSVGSLTSIVGFTITGGRAANGGGMYCTSSSPALTNCTFTANETEDGGGGGMYCDGSSSPTLTDCTLTGNQAYYGGGMCCYGSSSPTLTNCIIAFGQQGEAIYCANGGSAELACCDVYGNEGGDWVGCIALQYGVDGNLNQDPLFCDIYNDDTTLCANSPCLPGGNGCGVLIGAHGQGCAACSAPVQRSSWGAIKAMYR